MPLKRQYPLQDFHVSLRHNLRMMDVVSTFCVNAAVSHRCLFMDALRVDVCDNLQLCVRACL